jgi:hypothetical protein
MRSDDEIAQEVIRKQTTMQGKRGNWEQFWEQIAQRIFPNYARQFVGHNFYLVPGSQRTEEMVDATGAIALMRFAAAMESMLTPRHSKWHYLVPADKTLKRNRLVRLWFEDLTEALFDYRYAPKANYASNKHEDYMCLGAFGTGCMFIDKLDHQGQKGLRYRSIHLGQMYFLENHQGIIDTAYRRFSLTARQAVQQFGIEALPDTIAQKAKNSAAIEEPFWFIHGVEPRDEYLGEYDPKRLDTMGMAQASYYISLEGQKLVKKGGYHTFPYAISRYVLAPGESYGRSPAMMALPSLKVLNEEKKTVLKQGHRTVDPILLAHDDGIMDSISLRPGSVVPGGVDEQGRVLVHPLPVGDLSLAKEMMEAERTTINDFFLVSLFQILVDSPTMTATEVLERAKEKGAFLSPTMGRQQSESLGPQIEREIDVMQQQRLIPEMPQMLKDAMGEYKAEYDSPLTRMAKAEEAAGLFRYVGEAKEVASVTGDLSMMDHVDWDTAAPELLDIHSVPKRWQSSGEKIAAKRDARDQAAQKQQMTDAAPAMASVAKTMQGAAPAQAT